MITMLRTLSTMQSNLNGRRQVADLSRQLQEAGQEATTGVKSDRYRALGSRAEGAMITRARQSRLEGFASSNATLDRRLEMIGRSLDDMRESLQTVLTLAAPNLGEQTVTGPQLQAAAEVALAQITGQVNRSYEGVSLFAGVENGVRALQPFDEQNPATGLSPRDVVAGVVGAGPGNAAAAATMADDLAAKFDAAAPGPDSYAATFYNGAARNGDGKGLQARIDEEEILDYGVQADDPAFANLVRGLSMLAAVDVGDLSDETAQVWVNRAVEAMERGRDGLLSAETRIGAQRRHLESTMQAQDARLTLYRQQVNELEGADPYEAATRLTQLQTQLEASYAVTARLSKLSFIDFMR
ncbi:flagellin [Limimaricola pyoseonensis]|uniref:Flagellar hook-associated protein 3 FlgL n=1 Tax=Limimaricola pyoseonensis TaxID=521013 RepID=A0A1G7KAW2_9RHOB|nr:flagellin [Limimaricola pyoseonensis]SDF34458.1 flagellar hook-associated protein 3 FlgL [Limimaricola pyoseonensis]